MKDLNKVLEKLGREVARTKEKIDKIDDFFKSEESKDLDFEEKGLMIAQQFLFNSLTSILARRMKKIEKRKG